MTKDEMRRAQARARVRKRRKRRSRGVTKKGLVAVLVLCFVTSLLLNQTAAAGENDAATITLQPEDVVITQGEPVPEFKAAAACDGDVKETLNEETGLTIGDLVEELNQGKGYTLSSKGDGAEEGKFEIQAELASEITESLLSEWLGKVQFQVKAGTLEVRNPYGEWKGSKFRRWDGTYVANDFITYHGSTYYFDVDGKRASGWQEVNGSKYFFSKKGVMQTGWMKDGKEKYYFADNGIMSVGWQTIEEAKYYFDKDGKMLTGEQKIGTKECVFAADGKLESMEGGVDPEQPMIALTFDDGPGPRTEELLKVLKKHDARATFFMLGTSAGNYPDAIRMMQETGCELGNHSYNHPQFTQLDAAGIQKQMNDTNGMISQATGQRATVMRPPYGAINDTVKANVGLPMILWSIDTLDWKTRDAQMTVDNVLNTAGDGDIVLMHDIHTESIDAAIQMIPKLIAKGYQLVTVSELAEARGITMENGGVYASFWK